MNSSQTQIQIPPFHDPEGFSVDIKVFLNGGYLNSNDPLFKINNTFLTIAQSNFSDVGTYRFEIFLCDTIILTLNSS